MHDKITKCLHRLSSRRAYERKQAIKELRTCLCHKDGHLARLSLLYVAEHDPCYTVRNIAKQAFYFNGMPPPKVCAWERAHCF